LRTRSSRPCSPDRLRWHRSDPPLRLRPARDPGAATGSPAPLKRRGASGFGFGPLCRPFVPPASAANERVNHRRDSIGPRRHGLPRCLGHGPSKAELRLDRKRLTGSGIAGMVRIARDLVGDDKAHGRNERQVAGNDDMDATDSSAEQRLEVGCSVGFRRASRQPTSVGPGAMHGAPRGFGRGPARTLPRENPTRYLPCNHPVRVSSRWWLDCPPTPPRSGMGKRRAILTRRRRLLRHPHAACVR
jgi:hypothetical protein